MDAVVKVFCVHTEPNFSPVAAKEAHYSQVMHKKHRSDAKYLATVLAIGTEGDIALLTVNDDGFLKAVSPNEFGELPALQDATISVTIGVVSRIEILSYVHGSTELLGLQMDAAINLGNSGGPASDDKGHRVGIGFQSLKGEDVENIGHAIPTPKMENPDLQMDMGYEELTPLLRNLDF
ncbi:hypothetical protein P3X46_035008 [Hevea brasiliensis]|uniref:Uncharacterized protein n=1 Tax=Hevea brasiliensis TaxID=3981 RepID=A0ABQ9K881_HEVBR|nr:hypothetical protein P3X46_035008 [Hevea brasiliensis]